MSVFVRGYGTVYVGVVVGRTVAVNDSSDECGADQLSVAFEFNQTKNCVRHLLMKRFKQTIPPDHQRKLQNITSA